jgi:hypothetical protein
MIMPFFDPKEYDEKNIKKLRADMFLPDWLNYFGIICDIIAAVFLIVPFITKEWVLLFVPALLAPLGIAAFLCWKNQTVKIIDSNHFEYTTFLGKKTLYRFSDIKQLRLNSDSMTLFVGDGKVHIEFIAFISNEFMEKIYDNLPENNDEE